MAAKIKFRKAAALPPAIPANDGVWFIKGGSDTKFKYYLISGGVIIGLNAPTEQEITAALALKQDKFSGTTAQYVRGDGSLATLDKAAVGLNNVDNTSDANKPVSTAQLAALNLKIDKTEKGAANGVATLGADGKVPSGQLPSYVDDVLEFANLAVFPGTGESGKIYVALDTDKQYRWGGSGYIHINKGDVTEMASFFVRYDSAQALTAPQKTQGRNNIGAADDTAVVKLTGAQTIAGAKTFSAAPISSVAASAANELMRKGEVEALVTNSAVEWTEEAF